MPEPQIQFRSKELLPSLEARSERSPHVQSNSEVARADLFRYYRLLAGARQRMRGRFSINELNVIAGANMLRDYEKDRANFLVRVDDGIKKDGLAERWPVNAFALTSKLQRLDDLDMHALIDAIECFWCQPDGFAKSSQDFFEQLGLL